MRLTTGNSSVSTVNLCRYHGSRHVVCLRRKGAEHWHVCSFGEIQSAPLYRSVTNAVTHRRASNGLAGGISFIASVVHGQIAYLSGNHLLASLCMASAGAIGAFLRYTRTCSPRHTSSWAIQEASFSGSPFRSSRSCLPRTSRYHVEPNVPYARSDSCLSSTRFGSMGLRVFSGRNPFKADTNHLHHLLLRAGFSRRKAFSCSGLSRGPRPCSTLIHFRGTSMPYLMVVLTGSTS